MTTMSPRSNKVKSLTTSAYEQRPLGDVMREAQHALVVHLERALRGAGYDDVGAAHASVLAIVDRAGSRLAALAENGGRTKQATAELAGHLVARGYLNLQPDPSDGRAKLYRTTRSGEVLLRDCADVVTRYEEWLEGALGEGGIDRLRHALIAIIDHAESENHDQQG